MATKETIEQTVARHDELLQKLSCLADEEIVKALKQVIKDQQENAAANKKIAKIARVSVAIIGSIGVFITTISAIAWLMVTLGQAKQ